MLVLTRDQKVLLQLSFYLAVIDHGVVIVIVFIVVLVLIVGMQTLLPDLLF